MDDFWVKWQPIALLFGEKWLFLGTFWFVVAVEES